MQPSVYFRDASEDCGHPFHAHNVLLKRKNSLVRSLITNYVIESDALVESMALGFDQLPTNWAIPLATSSGGKQKTIYSEAGDCVFPSNRFTGRQSRVANILSKIICGPPLSRPAFFALGQSPPTR